MYAIQFRPNVSFQGLKKYNYDFQKIDDAVSQIRHEFAQKSLQRKNFQKKMKLSLKKMQLVNLFFEADFKKNIAVFTTSAGKLNRITGSVTQRMTIAEMENFLRQKNNVSAKIHNFIEQIRYGT